MNCPDQSRPRISEVNCLHRQTGLCCHVPPGYGPAENDCPYANDRYNYGVKMGRLVLLAVECAGTF